MCKSEASQERADATVCNVGKDRLNHSAMTVKPNLFIVGAAKCGTTSLHQHLARHPDVFMSEPKEPGFFTPEVGYYPSDPAWYLGLFADGSGRRYRGESSTHYTKRPRLEGVVDRIADFVDEEPRFIYLMRDPLDRAVSHYWHNVRTHSEHRDIRTAFEEVPEYLAVSDYAMQLEPYLDRFGPGAVCATTFESLVGRSAETVGAVLEWLNLAPPPPSAALRKENARPEQFTRVRGHGTLHRLTHSQLWDRLSPLAPAWLKDLGRRATYAPAQAVDANTDETLDAIRPRVLEGVERLERLLDRSFPEWTTTRHGGPQASRGGT